MNGSDFSTALALAAPGLFPTKGTQSGPIFTQFCFTGEYVYSCNATLSIQAAIPGCTFDGCVPGYQLLSLSRELANEPELVFKAKSKIGQAVLLGETLKLELPSTPSKEFMKAVPDKPRGNILLEVEVTEELVNVLEVCTEVCLDPKDTASIGMTGITLRTEEEDLHVFATNNAIIVHKKIEGVIKKNSLPPWEEPEVFISPSMATIIAAGFKLYGAEHPPTLIVRDQHYEIAFGTMLAAYAFRPQEIELPPYVRIMQQATHDVANAPVQDCTQELRSAFKQAKAALSAVQLGQATLKGRKNTLRISVANNTSKHTNKVQLTNPVESFNCSLDIKEITKFLSQTENIRVGEEAIKLETYEGIDIYLATEDIREYGNE